MEHEITIRLISFVLIFILVALWEIRAPRRNLTTSKKWRWFNNLSIIAINPVFLRLVFPVLAVGMAQTAQAKGWGLLNHFGTTNVIALVAGIIALDLVIYLQHVMFHAVPILWRLHMVHHADLDFDLTTGLRFHPIEIILSMGIKLSVVALIGVPASAVLIFEVLLNGVAMFNHGNIKIPLKMDRLLRYFVVTPDMHRVHHSVIIKESNSNFGFNLPWWDRLFGTYTTQPSKGHIEMTIGLAQFRNIKQLMFHHLLLLPFTGDTGRQPINRH